MDNIILEILNYIILDQDLSIFILILRFFVTLQPFSGSLKPNPTKKCVFLTLYSLLWIVLKAKTNQGMRFLSLYSLPW